MKDKKTLPQPVTTLGFLLASFVAAWHPSVPAQIKLDPKVERVIRERGLPPEPKTARAYPVGEHADKPIPWTEAERSLDVMQRPRFLNAVGATLQPVLRTVGPGIRVDPTRIDRERIESMKTALSTVLQPGIVPGGWHGVEIYGNAQRFKEWPAGVPMPADTVMELDLSVPIEHLEPSDRLYAEWSAGGIDILATGSTKHGVSLRLRLPPERRMQLSSKPRDFVEYHNNHQYFWDFFDRKALHGLLTTVFQVPFAMEDDFVLEGYTQELEGVRCFFGTLMSKEYASRGRHGAPHPAPAWWNKVKVFVTDSDPQYFCVHVEFSPLLLPDGTQR